MNELTCTVCVHRTYVYADELLRCDDPACVCAASSCLISEEAFRGVLASVNRVRGRTGDLP